MTAAQNMIKSQSICILDDTWPFFVVVVHSYTLLIGYIRKDISGIL